MNLIIYVLIMLVFFTYENNKLDVTRIKMKNNIKNRINILQLSDLHSKEFGKENKQLIKRIRLERPDIIVITGDLVDCSSKRYQEIVKFTEVINNIAPVFYIPGNHETRSEKYEEIIKNLKSSGVMVLMNEIREIDIRGTKVNILGLVEKQGSADDYIKRARGIFKYKDNSLIFKELEERDGLKIVLCHYPENFKGIGESSYYKYKFDLMFSGHAHGGQFRIPFIGGLYAPAQGILPKYTAGVHYGKNNRLIISRGLGNSGFPIRLFNRPEIVVVTIEK